MPLTYLQNRSVTLMYNIMFSTYSEMQMMIKVQEPSAF
jgi:hypothetical protein